MYITMDTVNVYPCIDNIIHIIIVDRIRPEGVFDWNSIPNSRLSTKPSVRAPRSYPVLPLPLLSLSFLRLSRPTSRSTATPVDPTPWCLLEFL